VGEGLEAGRDLGDAVAVGHPDGERGGQTLEERRVGSVVDDGVAVLALVGGFDLAAELVGEELHAVADAEDGKSGLEDVGRQLGRVVVVDRGRAAREDEAGRVELADVVPGGVVGDELGVDAGLADAAGDEHRELRPEVEDDDGLRVDGRRLGLRFAFERRLEV